MIDKELELLAMVQRRPDATQRALAEGTGLSLGTTNLLLRRFAEAGLLDVRSLSPRNSEYHLTPAGELDLRRRRLDAASALDSAHRSLVSRAASRLRAQAAAGRRRFEVRADPDLRELVRAAFLAAALPEAELVFVEIPAGNAESPLWACRQAPEGRAVPLLEDGEFPASPLEAAC
jgi:hypothetical protein